MKKLLGSSTPKASLYKNVVASNKTSASIISINSVTDAYFQTEVYNLNIAYIATSNMKSIKIN